MLTSGQLLAERYRLGRRIAVGGMGEVWQAVDVRLDRTVAVKVLKPELCGDAEFLHRFRTEARTTASLNHPGIAAVHDYGETAALQEGPEDTAYLVMELVEGEPLATILAREGRITAERTLEMLEQAGNALQAAHERGLVHRDVKPGNILVTATGTVKLTDFGIAKAADAAPVTRSGMVMGTAHYISPEQALGSDASPSSDVYSLAVVGYECLKGHRPFLSDNAVTVAMMHIREMVPPLPPDVPPGLRALIEATLVKDPRYRYSGGGEFANAVVSIRAGGPLPTPAALAVPPQQQRQPQRTNAGAPGTGVHRFPGPAMPQGPPAGMPPTGGVTPQSPGPSPGGPSPGYSTGAPTTGTFSTGTFSTGTFSTGAPSTGPPSTGMPPASGTPPGSIHPPAAAPPRQPPPSSPGRASRTGLWVFLAVVVVVVLTVGSVATWRVLTQGGPSQDSPSQGGSAPSTSAPNHSATFARQVRPHGRADVRFVDLDSGRRLGHTALRNPEPVRTVTRPDEPGPGPFPVCGNRGVRVGGRAAHRIPVREAGPWLSAKHRRTRAHPTGQPATGRPATEQRTKHASEVGGTAQRAPVRQREVTGHRLSRDGSA